jgi:hypothetical protein
VARWPRSSGAVIAAAGVGPEQHSKHQAQRHQPGPQASTSQGAPPGGSRQGSCHGRRPTLDPQVMATMAMTLRVVVPPHPLIGHWLSVLRDRHTPPAPLCHRHRNELGRWLTYEALRQWLAPPDGRRGDGSGCHLRARWWTPACRCWPASGHQQALASGMGPGPCCRQRPSAPSRRRGVSPAARAAGQPQCRRAAV